MNKCNTFWDKSELLLLFETCKLVYLYSSDFTAFIVTFLLNRFSYHFILVYTVIILAF